MQNTCKHEHVYHDRYKTICSDCGLVLEDNNIVNELNFGETTSGQGFVHGQFVDIGQDNVTARTASRQGTLMRF